MHTAAGGGLCTLPLSPSSADLQRSQRGKTWTQNVGWDRCVAGCAKLVKGVRGVTHEVLWTRHKCVDAATLCSAAKPTLLQVDYFGHTIKRHQTSTLAVRASSSFWTQAVEQGARLGSDWLLIAVSRAGPSLGSSALCASTTREAAAFCGKA